MYQSYIGLEVHIHLLTKTKCFCRCRSAFGDKPNTNVCPVCMGYPGALPALNIEAVRMGCMVARSLNCTIPPRTWFERKQYFYPDMPKNYQITQFASPLGKQGFLELTGHGTDCKEIKKNVRIKECHLEEDAGKMIHKGTVSLLDYNRAGVSLLEIVTEPDFESGEEAELFIQELRRIVRYLGVCNGNMEEGSLRADANVSINILGKGLGKKVEIKNLNSSRFVRLGLNYEIRRQSEILDAGKTIVQETRLWDESRGETMPMRQKEDTQDYRYFPEPDLPVFCPDDAFLASVNDAIVELPRARMTRIKNQYGLSEEQAELICGEKESADYFEAAAAIVPEEAVKIANWFLSDIKHILTREGITIKNIGFFSLNPNRLASLVKMISEGRITAKLAKQCMELAIADNKDPEEIVKANNWEQLSDPEKIAAVVKTVLAAEKKAVSELRTIISSDNISTNEKRRKSLTAYLVGKVLAATGGRADPKTAGDQVNKLLSELHYSQGAENE
ncbi:MAG: Asp-tRNA(Asn)/Glu-tRNA(Gln) amidotransferase subunit GatB [Treponema sp.]|nr:Asp-tRNA(Asn)/Glu-tRNA(Gln) amidotransferase subunit GatB [Treponema sp.]